MNKWTESVKFKPDNFREKYEKGMIVQEKWKKWYILCNEKFSHNFTSSFRDVLPDCMCMLLLPNLFVILKVLLFCVIRYESNWLLNVNIKNLYYYLANVYNLFYKMLKSL